LGESIHVHDTIRRRVALAEQQQPFAVALGCADSRVSPEIIFDAGLGGLFSVRVAGAVADVDAIGSIEFAVEQFATPLVVVLGHSRCGAVAATIEAVANGTQGRGHISSLVRAIAPSLPPGDVPEDDHLNATVKRHVRAVAERLRHTAPFLDNRVASGELKILPAFYELRTGAVDFLS
jgi:carbonic anhydrase